MPGRQQSKGTWSNKAAPHECERTNLKGNKGMSQVYCAHCVKRLSYSTSWCLATLHLVIQYIDSYGGIHFFAVSNLSINTKCQCTCFSNLTSALQAYYVIRFNSAKCVLVPLTAPFSFSSICCICSHCRLNREQGIMNTNHSSSKYADSGCSPGGSKQAAELERAVRSESDMVH